MFEMTPEHKDNPLIKVVDVKVKSGASKISLATPKAHKLASYRFPTCKEIHFLGYVGYTETPQGNYYQFAYQGIN